MNEKVHGWLATARIANVPSVISNVWFGIALGAYHWGWENDRQLFIDGALLALSGFFLYIGGNFLNDWHDLAWDEKHRPERALPSGLFSPLSYLLRAVRFLGLGVVIAALVNSYCTIVAATIVANIVIYTRWHKKAIWPVIPMGLCRALLPVMGYLAVAANAHPALSFFTMSEGGKVHLSPSSLETGKTIGFITLHAAGLFVWIVGLSLTARYESIPNPPPGPKLISRVMLFLPIFIMSVWWMRWYPLLTLMGMIPFVAWLLLLIGKKRPVPVLVSGFLAGIPLVEWITCFPLALSQVPAGDSVAKHPVLAVTLLLPAVTFILGRRLQAVASAT